MSGFTQNPGALDSCQGISSDFNINDSETGNLSAAAFSVALNISLIFFSGSHPHRSIVLRIPKTVNPNLSIGRTIDEKSTERSPESLCPDRL
jgi:hypothetical protein